MNLEQVLEIASAAVFNHAGRQLSDVETAILTGAWQGQTYGQIAEASGYSFSYLTRDVGPKFWKLLSQSLGETVSKTSFRAALERRWRTHPEPDTADVSLLTLPEHSQVRKALTDASSPQEAPDSNAAQPTASPKIASPTPAATITDWGEASDVSFFCGRAEELTTLQQWIVQDQCHMLVVLGMGGIGKTSLSVKLAREVLPNFNAVIWRSLRNAPPLEELLPDLVAVLSGYREPQADLRRLVHWLQTSRCLLILDNVETIMQAGDRAGQLRSGYEDYGDLFRVIGESAHQSCLVLTSREKPAEIAALEGAALSVRSLQLVGSSEVSQALLQAKGLQGTPDQQQQLCERYGHNPLAIKIIATSIQELFDGDIAAFLEQETVVFSSIRKLLDQQFSRLSPVEQSLMYWLALNREWTSIAELVDDSVPSLPRNSLLEALESLSWRSLIEKWKGSYTQQPVVMEYVSDRLADQIAQEILQGLEPDPANQPDGKLMPLLQSHALLKAQARDYVRTTQSHLILQPILSRLAIGLGSPDLVQQHLFQLCKLLQAQATAEFGYAGGNLLNLLCHLKADLSHADFSHLTIWQADLQDVTLHNVNFAHADLTKSVFATTLSAVLSVAFSPDGQFLATADVEDEVRIWRVADGQLTQTLQGHTNWVHTVQFSADGEFIVSGSEDETIRLWDAHTGDCLHVFKGHTSRVWSVAISPNSQLLASGSEDATIRLWDLASGDCLQTLQGHSHGVQSVAFASDQILASGSADHTVRLWNVTTGTCLTTLAEHEDSVWSVAFSAVSSPFHRESSQDLSSQTQWLASGSSDRTLKLWQVSSTGAIMGSSITLSGHKGWVWSVAFSPVFGTCAEESRQFLASGSDDNTVKLWDLQEVQQRSAQANSSSQVKQRGDRASYCLKTFRGHTSRVWSVAFSPNGQLLASGSKDQTTRLWDFQRGQCLRTLKGYTNWVQCIAFSPDGQLLASAHEDQTVRLWNVETGTCLHTLSGHEAPPWSVAFSPDGRWLVSSGEDCMIRLWNVANGLCRQVLRGHTSRVWCVAFAPDLQPQGEFPVLASSSGDQTIKLWDLSTGKCLKVLEGHGDRVWSVAFSPDGKTLASGSGDRTVKLWDLNTGTCLNTLDGHHGWIFSVAFSPDGELLASSGSDQTVRLWNSQTGACIQTLQGQSRLMLSAKFSPAHSSEKLHGASSEQHEQALACATDDQTVEIWNLQTGKRLQVLKGHLGWVWSIAYDPQTGRLASGSQDETLKIWEVETGTCLKTLRTTRPYEGMNITHAVGLTAAQKATLETLGAITDADAAS